MIASGEGAPAGPSLDLSADRERALALVPVSRETLARLDRFVALLIAWQQHTNLIARSTMPTLWTRHIANSLQLVGLAPAARVWADLGSGGGFPGLVIACALAETEGAHVHLVESIGKKAIFLREAVRVTGAPATVHAERIEDFVDKSPRISRCGDGASSGAVAGALGDGLSVVENRGLGSVSKGTRCGGRIDRSR